MNRFATLISKSSYQVGTYLVVTTAIGGAQTEAPIIQLRLHSEFGDIRAFLFPYEPGSPLPRTNQRIFALLLILHFGQPPYGFIQEFVPLPEIF